jgi:nitrate reductase NapAB chaperone NapD
MAIAGLLVHCLKEELTGIEAKVGSMPEMTTYGTQQDQYLVVVAEAPSQNMEKTVERLQDIDGVLAVYTTYVSIEDELTDAQV